MLHQHLAKAGVPPNERELREMGEQPRWRCGPSREVLNEEDGVLAPGAKDLRRVRVEAAGDEKKKAPTFGLDEQRRFLVARRNGELLPQHIARHCAGSLANL